MEMKIMINTEVVFYTLPPIDLDYPYILCNLNSFGEGYRYIRKHFRSIRSVIIDSGIEIFRDPNVKDYPKDIEYRLVRSYNKAVQFCSNTYITVPDYCDDHHPKSLWINEKITNIERTVKNVEYYTSKYDFNWLIPIQGHYKKPETVFRCLNLYDKIDIFEKYRYFAVGMLCIENDKKIIQKTLSNVREILPHKKYKIHVFGLKLKALKYVSHLINSFDSMAWTRPVNNSIKKYFQDRKNRSVRTACSLKGKVMEKIYFEQYIKTISKYLNIY